MIRVRVICYFNMSSLELSHAIGCWEAAVAKIGFGAFGAQPSPLPVLFLMSDLASWPAIYGTLGAS